MWYVGEVQGLGAVDVEARSLTAETEAWGLGFVSLSALSSLDLEAS